MFCSVCCFETKLFKIAVARSMYFEAILELVSVGWTGIFPRCASISALDVRGSPPELVLDDSLSISAAAARDSSCVVLFRNVQEAWFFLEIHTPNLRPHTQHGCTRWMEIRQLEDGLYSKARSPSKQKYKSPVGGGCCAPEIAGPDAVQCTSRSQRPSRAVWGRPMTQLQLKLELT